MKKMLGVFAIVAMIGISAPAFAQDTTKKENLPKKAWKGTKKGAKKVGNKTAELATKGKGEVTDQTSSEWVGPNGQRIYVDDGNKYYYVSDKGKRVFVTKDQLKPKQ